jgi:hypothetical protein
MQAPKNFEDVPIDWKLEDLVKASTGSDLIIEWIMKVAELAAASNTNTMRFIDDSESEGYLVSYAHYLLTDMIPENLEYSVPGIPETTVSSTLAFVIGYSPKLSEVRDTISVSREAIVLFAMSKMLSRAAKLAEKRFDDDPYE